ncbi:MAG: phosphatase PAP2 family protein [Lachnospiraceae bacterium]|nr:phosphatase PAP2 family protein [Lachnospiraceae bacterium]
MEFSFLVWLQGFHRPWLDALMVAVTFLGDAGWFWILTGCVLFCIKKTRICGLAVLLSLAAGFLVGNCLLKNIVARSRPCWLLDVNTAIVLLVETPLDYSFPSGHTLAGFEAGVSILLFHRTWGIAALVLAALIAFSRLYLFVHFPTDVLAGAVLGTVIAFGVHQAMARGILPGCHRLVYQNKKGGTRT